MRPVFHVAALAWHRILERIQPTRRNMKKLRTQTDTDCQIHKKNVGEERKNQLLWCETNPWDQWVRSHDLQETISRATKAETTRVKTNSLANINSQHFAAHSEKPGCSMYLTHLKVFILCMGCCMVMSIRWTVNHSEAHRCLDFKI
jgi:hypothetical protein